MLNSQSSNQWKRCAVYMFYDEQGVVDDYNIVFLQELRKHVQEIVIVCNGYINEEGRNRFKSITSHIILRENIGFDVAAYQMGFFQLSKEILDQMDEIIFLNYTFYGPFYPLEEMFGVMESKQVDFWGITAHAKMENDPFEKIEYGYMPKHIQSYFLVLRKKLFQSDLFLQYFKELELPQTYEESITRFEAVFTKKFEDLGFTWDTYIDTTDYEPYAYSPIMYYPKELIEEKRCPVMKRRSFFNPYLHFLDNSCGECTKEAFDYIQEAKLYDLNLIWDNLLRKETFSDVCNALHMNYFISSCHHEFYQEDITREVMNQVLIVLYCNNETVEKYYVPHIQKMEKEYAIKVLTKEDGETFEEAIYSICSQELEDSSFLCFLNGSEFKSNEALSNPMSLFHKNCNHLLPSNMFVQNVIQRFITEPRLGLLSPLTPDFGTYHGEIYQDWEEKSRIVRKIIDEIKVGIPFHSDTPPIAPVDGSCWMRKEIYVAMKNQVLIEQAICAFGYCLPFIGQIEGFYSGWLINTEYSGIEFTNNEYMIRESNKLLFSKYGGATLPNMMSKIHNNLFQSQKDLAIELVEDLPIGRKRKIKNFIKKITPEKFYELGKKIYRKAKM